MSSTKRNEFIDIVKGASIFLMLWGHCIQYCSANSNVDFFENTVFKVIYSFHMPLFMLISGYLLYYSFLKRDLRQLLIHRTQALLQPIVFCTFLNYLITAVFFDTETQGVLALFDGKWLTSLSSLWFLWSVLASTLVVAVVCKKIKNTLIQVLVLIAAVPVISLFPNADLNLYMYPFFVAGFYFAKYKDKLPRFLNQLKYISLPLFVVLICFFKKHHYIYTTGLYFNKTVSLKQMLPIASYRWLIGFVGSVFALTVLEMLYKLISNKLKKPAVLCGVSALGKKSLEIYALSVALLSDFLCIFFPKLLSALKIQNVFVNNILVYNYVFTLLLAVVYSVLLYFVIKLFQKTKVSKVIFGK